MLLQIGVAGGKDGLQYLFLWLVYDRHINSSTNKLSTLNVSGGDILHTKMMSLSESFVLITRFTHSINASHQSLHPVNLPGVLIALHLHFCFKKCKEQDIDL